MADADNKENLPNDQTKVQGVTKTELDAKLGEVQEQLKAMNSQFADSLQSLASAVKPPQKQQPTFSDDDIYDPAKLETKVAAKAGEIAQQIVARERELNATIYNMAQDYPEIQSDPAIQKAVREAQATLPANMRDSALGIETAILKAVTKAGLVPKSRRPVVDDEPSVSGTRSAASGSSSGKKQKIDPRTLEFAQLLGRDITNADVLKGLEEASQRDGYNRYR
jgi:hypothetical protein